MIIINIVVTQNEDRVNFKCGTSGIDPTPMEISAAMQANQLVKEAIEKADFTQEIGKN